MCVCGKAIGSLCVWKGQWIIVYVCVCVERPLDNCVCVCVGVWVCVERPLDNCVCVWKGHWIIVGVERSMDNCVCVCVCGKAIG